MAFTFEPGPVDQGGIYETRRSAWDGPLGFLDGIASATTSIGYTVDAFADIREDTARGRAAIADQRLDEQEREQDIFLDYLTTERGDNRQLYLVVGVVAIGAILFLR